VITKILSGYQVFCYPVYCHFFKFCLLLFQAALEECTSAGAELAKTRSQPSVQLLCLPLHLNTRVILKVMSNVAYLATLQHKAIEYRLVGGANYFHIFE
jgi:hypothetical protein